MLLFFLPIVYLHLSTPLFFITTVNLEIIACAYRLYRVMGIWNIWLENLQHLNYLFSFHLRCQNITFWQQIQQKLLWCPAIPDKKWYIFFRLLNNEQKCEVNYLWFQDMMHTNNAIILKIQVYIFAKPNLLQFLKLNNINNNRFCLYYFSWIFS